MQLEHWNKQTPTIPSRGDVFYIIVTDLDE